MMRGLARAAALIAVSARVASAAEPAEVEVHGEDASPPPKEPSVAGSVIRAERLRAPGLQASDVLRTQPGVTVSETGGYGGLSTASIRGATAAETPVYLGGVRLNDDVGGTADLSLVPLWLLDRVEVYRSNAPLDGDELGIGGAIYFEPRIPKKTGAAAGAMTGSFGARGLWGRAEAGNSDTAALVGVRYDGARNDYAFVDDRGTRFDASDDRTVTRTNADARTVDLWALARQRLGHVGHADLVVNDTEREQGLPGLTLFPSTKARATASRRLAALTARVPCATGDRCALAATTSVLVTRTGYDDPLREVALGSTQLELAGARVEEAIRPRLRFGEDVTISPALHVSAERLSVDASSSAALRAKRVSGRGGLSADWTASRVVVVHGLGAAECHSTTLEGDTAWSFPQTAAAPTDSGRACGAIEPSLRGGIEMFHGPFEFLANVGRYARVPTLAELYGISGAVRGNSELSPETGISGDVGLRARAPRGAGLRGAFLDLFGFVRVADHLIAFQRSSLGYVRPFNVGSARVAGVELLAGFRPLPFALVELATTLLDPRDTTPRRVGNDVLPYQSRLVVVPRVELRASSIGAVVQSATISSTYFFESSRYADAAGLIVIPEQSSLDVEAEATTLGDHVAIRARMSNVLNRTRVDLIGYPLPGRAAYVALEAKW